MLNQFLLFNMNYVHTNLKRHDVCVDETLNVFVADMNELLLIAKHDADCAVEHRISVILYSTDIRGFFVTITSH